MIHNLGITDFVKKCFPVTFCQLDNQYWILLPDDAAAN